MMTSSTKITERLDATVEKDKVKFTDETIIEVAAIPLRNSCLTLLHLCLNNVLAITMPIRPVQVLGQVCLGADDAGRGLWRCRRLVRFETNFSFLVI